jgi:hypothetical protein
MRNEECVLGLAERDEYIVFQNYVVSIVMKQRCFGFFFFFFKKPIDVVSFVLVRLIGRLNGGSVWFRTDCRNKILYRLPNRN